MKKVRVAVVGSYKGVFKEWEYLGGKNRTVGEAKKKDDYKVSRAE